MNGAKGRLGGKNRSSTFVLTAINFFGRFNIFFPFFCPLMFHFHPFLLVQSGLTYPHVEFRHVKSFTSKPPPGIRSGICIHAPTQYPPKLDFPKTWTPAGSYNFKDLERAVLYFYFIFRCPDLVFFFHPTLHQTPHPYSIWP